MGYPKKYFSRRGGYSVATSDYRSGLEDSISAQLKGAKIGFTYEKHKITYEIPAKKHTYTPDFVLSNGIIIEAKGLFDSADRAKHLLVKKQHPELDIRFVFSNPNTKLYKGSNTTYGSWCQKHGFKYAAKYVPTEWLKEKQKPMTGLDVK